MTLSHLSPCSLSSSLLFDQADQKGEPLLLRKTKDIPRPNQYVQGLDGEYSQWAFNEERAIGLRGKWRSEIFKQPENYPLDLEIGTGNGYFFAHRSQTFPNRGLVGIEIKFKPLIQSIRRARSNGSTNARVVRFNAKLVEKLFVQHEINHVFIHHPDPWEKKKKNKHRLIQKSFLLHLYHLQRPGCFLEFKTDSRDYFLWTLDELAKTPYQLIHQTHDLHQSDLAKNNFITHFEKIFIRQGQPIHYALLTTSSD